MMIPIKGDPAAAAAAAATSNAWRRRKTTPDWIAQFCDNPNRKSDSVNHKLWSRSVNSLASCEILLIQIQQDHLASHLLLHFLVAQTDGERGRARARERETEKRFHTTDLIPWNLSSTLIGYQWDLGREICSHSIQWLRSWWREHKVGQIEIPKRFTGSRYLVDYRERERRFHTRNLIVWNLSSTLIGYHWDLGPGTCSHGIHWLRSFMTRTKSWTTRDPETVFCFLSRKWDPHVLQDLDTLGQKKVHEFQDLSCEEAS
jgi:hypothetical protein